MVIKKFFAILLVMLIFLELSLQGTDVYVKNKTRKRSKKAEHTRILVFGESNSYGVGLSNRLKEAYPFILKNKLEEKKPGKKFEVVNFSHPGQTSFSTLNNIELNLLKYKPDYIVLHLGINDINKELSPLSPTSPILKSKLIKLVYFSYLYFTFKDKIVEGENGEMKIKTLDKSSLFNEDQYAKNTGPSLKSILKIVKQSKIPFVMLMDSKAPPMVNKLITSLGKEAEVSVLELENTQMKEGHQSTAAKLIEFLKDKI